MEGSFVCLPDADGLGTFLRVSDILSIEVYLGEKNGRRTVFVTMKNGCSYRTETSKKSAYTFANSIVGNHYKIEG